jgi:hypothetical protein
LEVRAIRMRKYDIFGERKKSCSFAAVEVVYTTGCKIRD